MDEFDLAVRDAVVLLLRSERERLEASRMDTSEVDELLEVLDG